MGRYKLLLWSKSERQEIEVCVDLIYEILLILSKFDKRTVPTYLKAMKKNGL
jgi:hypothetical protein